MTTKVTGSVLADTAVSAGTYGGTQTLQAFTVDAQGRITYAANITSGVITAGTRGQGADIIVPTIQYNTLGQIVAATNTTIRTATTSVTGVVQLADSVSNTSTTAAATASAVKAAFDAAAANASTALSSAQANTGAGLIIVGSRANSAFAQANLAFTQANTSYGAFDKANSAGGVAASAFGQANLAYSTANSAGGVAASAFGQANLAFTAANTATNATNLTSGTVPSGRISGSYTGITGIGTLTTGSIPGSLISSIVSNATDTTNILGNSGQVATPFIYPTRQGNTTYTNSTGKPIFLFILLQSSAYWDAASLLINGTSMWEMIGGTDPGVVNANIQMVVPIGATYYLQLTNLVPNASYAFTYWKELR